MEVVFQDICEFRKGRIEIGGHIIGSKVQIREMIKNLFFRRGEKVDEIRRYGRKISDEKFNELCA